MKRRVSRQEQILARERSKKKPDDEPLKPITKATLPAKLDELTAQLENVKQLAERIGRRQTKEVHPCG